MLYYAKLCVGLIQEMHQRSDSVLPANRGSIEGYLACRSLGCVDDILAGVLQSPDNDGENGFLFSNFKDYVDLEETRTPKILTGQKYYIDGPSTLNMVMGPLGKVEQVCSICICICERLCADYLM